MTACMAPKEESKTTKFDLTHPRAARTTDEIPTPTSEFIQIKQKGTTYVWDSGWLDSSGKIKVTVPLETYVYVEYESYQSPHTERLGSGFSREFIVTSTSPDSLTIGIPVGYNSNHPYFEVTQDNTTDNETCCDNETEITIVGDKFSWSDNFTHRQTPTNNQVKKYQDFWDNVSVSDNWSKVSLGSPENLVSCDDPDKVITNYKAENDVAFSCNGRMWRIGRCGKGMSIAVGSTGDCSCTSNAWTVRPAIGNYNWGGVGKECSASSQKLTVIFER